MKFDITAKPTFRFDISLQDVNLLMKMSSHHYDQACWTASEPGGFIYGWKQSIEFSLKYNTEYPKDQLESVAYGDWRSIDTCLKILEHTAVLSPEEYKIADRLRSTFTSVLNFTRRELEKWQAKFDSETSSSPYGIKDR